MARVKDMIAGCFTANRTDWFYLSGDSVGIQADNLRGQTMGFTWYKILFVTVDRDRHQLQGTKIVFCGRKFTAKNRVAQVTHKLH